MFKARIVILAAILFGASFTSAQVSDDFGVWISGAYDQDITKDVTFKIKQEFRFDENVSRLKKSYTTARVGFEYIDWVRFQLNYRFILNQKSNGTFGHRHRLMADVVFRPINRRFSLSNRVRFQSEVRTVNYSERYGFAPATKIRNTIRASYQINRVWKPYVYVDLRFLIRDARNPYHTGFDRDRLRVGVDIALARKRTLDLYLMTSRDWNVIEPAQIFVFGASFSFGGSGRIFN